jgi:hypothetical protein
MTLVASVRGTTGHIGTGASRVEPVVRSIAPFWVNEKLIGAGGELRDVVVRPVRKRE